MKYCKIYRVLVLCRACSFKVCNGKNRLTVSHLRHPPGHNSSYMSVIHELLTWVNRTCRLMIKGSANWSHILMPSPSMYYARISSPRLEMERALGYFLILCVVPYMVIMKLKLYMSCTWVMPTGMESLRICENLRIC